MKVTDVIIDALRLVGREDLAELVGDGGTAEGEGAEVVRTLLYCYNAVEDELARFYFPLVFREEKTAAEGKISYSDLTYRPVRIVGVTVDGRAEKFRTEAQYIEVNADKAVVEYWYAPEAKELGGDSAYDGSEVGERLVAAGCAAEYCLLNGESVAAELWEGKYREAIDKARKTHRRARAIPPRRWV